MDNAKYKKFSDWTVLISSLAIFCFIIIVGTIYVPITPIYGNESQNNAQACGISGIILRADNSIVIDGWKDYSASRIANPSNPVIEFKNAPSGVHLGKNLVGETPVCFEDTMGSHCILLSVLRKVK